MSQELVGGRPEGDETGLSRDVVFTMLSNQRRRQVLHYLKRIGGQATVRDASRQVAAWENGVDPNELTYKQRKRVYTSLHQSHLPKLADVGIVEYDADRGTIELGAAVADLEVYMEVVPENEIPWSSYYLGLATLSLVLVTAAWLDLFPFAALPDAAYGALVAAAFGLSAAVQAYSDRRSRLGEWTEPPGVAETPSPAIVVAAGDPESLATDDD